MSFWRYLDWLLQSVTAFFPWRSSFLPELEQMPLAILLMLLALLLRVLRPSRFNPFPKKTLALGAALVMAALWSPLMILGQSAEVAGEAYWCLSDDAMISMRYAHNLVQGQGLVWNPGEWVEGYTNFLWTLYLAFLHLWSLPASKIPLLVLLTNLGLALAVIPLLIRIVDLLQGRTLTMVMTLGAYLLSKIPLGIALTGLETSLLTGVFLLGLYRVLLDARQGRARWATYLWIGLLPLIRMDAFLLSGLLAALSILLQQQKKPAILLALLSRLLPLGHAVFRLYYYGDLLPNTAYLKVMGWDNRYGAGLTYLFGFLRLHFFLLAPALVGTLFSRGREERLLWGLLGIYFLYIVSIGGDWFRNFRFFLPVFPLFLILSFKGIQNLAGAFSLRLAFSLLGLITMPLILPGYNRVVDEIKSYNRFDINNIRLGLLIKENTPPTIKVADVAAGTVFYYSERPGIDLLGKSDRYIARIPAVPQATRAGHNKFDYDYSLGVRRPDLVIAGFGLSATAEEMAPMTSGGEAFIGQLYFNPLFQRDYLPYPVTIPSSRAIFVAAWSDQLKNRKNWKDLPVKPRKFPLVRF